MRIRKPLDPSRFYIHKDDLLKAVLEYQLAVKKAEAENRPIPSQPNTIGLYIMDLVDKLSTRYNFRNYSYIDVMCGEAIEHCVKAVLKFNVEKSKASKTNNIFNYFTMVAWRAFQYRIIEEKKQNAIKHKNYQHTYRLAEIEGTAVEDISNNEYSHRVISEYEEKHTAKPSTTSLTTKKKSSKVSVLEQLMVANSNVIQSKSKASNSRSSSKPRKRAAKRTKSS